MTETLERPVGAPADRPVRSQRTWYAVAARVVLALLWLTVGLGIVLTGERPSSVPELKQAISAGEVDHVQWSSRPDGSPDGVGIVQLHWRDGLVHRTARVEDVRPGLAARLRALDPDLTTERVPYRWDTDTLLGWRVTSWVQALSQLGRLFTIAWLIGSPEPWRARRWGWFWLLVLVPPIGIPAYLLLSGPTRGLPTPRDLRRRESGASGFLLACILAIAGALATSLL